MKKSLLFIAALVIVSTDFIAQGSAQDKDQPKTMQSKTKATKDSSKEWKQSDTARKMNNNEELRKMENYKNNTPSGGSEAEQQHMDTTINNHR